MPYDLKGRNVLVTGGSAGLGEVISISFAKEGANVAVNYFNRPEPAQNVVQECKKQGVEAVALKGVSPLALLKAAKPTFESNPDGGAFISTGSIAAVSQSGSSMPYAVTKAAQLQLIKCLGATQGPKIRVNTVLPGLLLTEWGKKYSDEKIQWAKDTAALKHETDLQDCADAFIMLAKNASITGARIQVDAGLNVQGT
ncbi:hypothetical protein SLS60_000703 [Paraconiothyrium brasiliense]|uniref:Uncharacterized protein n=1 Tax=Paraconiothyrium brasiliense TaxID=300254 RepID=A0ABR3S6Z2_9PLEO